MGVALSAMAIGGVAMGVLGAINSADQASAQNAAAAAQYGHQVGKETWNYGEAVWGVAQKNAARRMQNKNVFLALTKNYAKQQIGLSKTFEERAKMLSRQEKSIQATTNSQLASKIGSNSGTAERIRAQMKLQGSDNWKNEFMSKVNAERSLEQQYENNLEQGTDLSYTQIGPYQPGLPPVPRDVGMAALMGGIQGANQGIQMVGGIMGGMNSYQQWKKT